MPTMELSSTNEQFALAAADMIELRGKSNGQYEDKHTGACCVLGAFRLLTFGRVNMDGTPSVMGRVPRYLELVDWLAEKVATEDACINNGETVVGAWNDDNPQHLVIAKLREVGRADVPAVPQA